MIAMGVHQSLDTRIQAFQIVIALAAHEFYIRQIINLPALFEHGYQQRLNVRNFVLMQDALFRMVSGMPELNSRHLAWIFILQAQQVSRSFGAAVVYAPDTLMPWIDGLGWGFRNLDRWQPFILLANC